MTIYINVTSVVHVLLYMYVHAIYTSMYVFILCILAKVQTYTASIWDDSNLIVWW